MAGTIIVDVLRTLAESALNGILPSASERDVGHRLSVSLRACFGPSARPKSALGVDGSVRNPDYALVLPGCADTPAQSVAIEFKLYRSRHTGAGELDRGLGQCFAYAEHYDAVILAAVYMSAPKTVIPEYWTRQDSPLWLQRNDRCVPVYFTARPLDWTVDWAASFIRAA